MNRATRHIRIATALLLAVLLMTATACKESEAGKALAQQGATAADALATYYDELSQDTLDTIELEAFLSTIRGVAFDLNTQKLLEERYEALQRRARLARMLGTTYKAFGDLSSFDASDEINASAQNLGSSFKSLPSMPASGIDAGKIVAGVATKLAEWQQSRDIRKANDLMLDSISGFLTVYARESELYKSISEERSNKVASVVTYLIKSKRVDALSLLDKVPRSLGLSLTGGGSTTDEMLNGLASLATVKQRRLMIASMQAGDDLQRSLELLKTAHEKLKANTIPALDEISKVVAKAQSALSALIEGRSNSQAGDAAHGK